MAGGVFPVDSSPITNDSVAKITLSIVITCIVAASSGLLFGYDLGISGYFLPKSPFPFLLTTTMSIPNKATLYSFCVFLIFSSENLSREAA